MKLGQERMRPELPQRGDVDESSWGTQRASIRVTSGDIADEGLGASRVKSEVAVTPDYT
jgi:hypothetical protein